MKMDVIKEVCVEYCKNTYALGITYHNKHNNKELGELLENIVMLESNIRKCNNINDIFKYKHKLENIMNRIEVIINA